MTLTLIIVRQNLHPDFKMPIRGEISPILVNSTASLDYWWA